MLLSSVIFFVYCEYVIADWYPNTTKVGNYSLVKLRKLSRVIEVLPRRPDTAVIFLHGIGKY